MAAEFKKAKNAWFQNKALEVEAGMLTGSSGKGAWKGLKDIRKGRCGLRSVRYRGIVRANCALVPSRYWKGGESILNLF